MAISPGGHYPLGSLSVTSNRDSSLATQRSVYSASHERAVTQQGLERQNFRVRGCGGECCISECRFSASGQLAAPSAGALRSWDKERSSSCRGNRDNPKIGQQQTILRQWSDSANLFVAPYSMGGYRGRAWKRAGMVAVSMQRLPNANRWACSRCCRRSSMPSACRLWAVPPQNFILRATRTRTVSSDSSSPRESHAKRREVHGRPSSHRSLHAGFRR
jgi:hypothetical protein